MKALRFISTCILSAALAGCSSIDCNIEGRVQCHYKVQDANGQDAELNFPLSITFHRPAVNDDTVFINTMSNVHSFDLPMSYGADVDEMSLTLHLSESAVVTDVVKVTKTNEPTFEAVDCAPRYNHFLQATQSTHNFIDTVIINNPKVSNDASVTNIIIRLRDNLNN